MGVPGKDVYPKGYRGFESLSLRQQKDVLAWAADLPMNPSTVSISSIITLREPSDVDLYLVVERGVPHLVACGPKASDPQRSAFAREFRHDPRDAGPCQYEAVSASVRYHIGRQELALPIFWCCKISEDGLTKVVRAPVPHHIRSTRDLTHETFDFCSVDKLSEWSRERLLEIDARRRQSAGRGKYLNAVSVRLTTPA